MSETAPTMRFPPVTLLRSTDPVVRSEGLEPPRFYSLPPQGSASTNSATSAFSRDRHRICVLPDQTGPGPDQDRITGADVTNQCWRDKACPRGDSYRLPGSRGSICLTSTAI